MAFSQITRWEVWNFMSIEHGCCEFDERNIINLKGYNDSGKSAMLTALKVCLANTNQSKQVAFIQDGKDYFRILVTFNDGVKLLRDKYKNGSSLYELYQNDDCIFSTKSKTNELTRVHEVPEPIEAYLGLITYENIVLNSRSCFETMIGVQTTGSENYKMFNTVLKSEEIATASTLLNTDKNKLNQEIGILESDIQAHKKLIGTSAKITATMVDALHMIDRVIDELEAKEHSLEKLQATEQKIQSIKIADVVPVMNTEQLDSITNVHNINAKLNSIQIADEVPALNGEQLSALVEVHNLMTAYDGVVTYPSIDMVAETRQLLELEQMLIMTQQLEEHQGKIDHYTKLAQEQLNYAEKLSTALEKSGAKVHHCPSCNYAFAE